MKEDERERAKFSGFGLAQAFPTSAPLTFGVGDHSLWWGLSLASPHQTPVTHPVWKPEAASDIAECSLEELWSESRSVVSESCDPTDYTVHDILQVRILEWVAFPFSRGSSQPRDQTQVSHTAGGPFTSWATR